MSVIRKNVPMAALAFFYLAFLGVEYLFDEKVALLAGAGSVAMAESVVVGISVAGFLLYPPALRFSERRIKPLLLVAGGLAAAFMLAGRASSPSGLWPSAGRVVNNVVSLAVAAPALALVTRANSLAISAVVLVVLAAIYAPVFLWLEKGAEPTVPGEPPAPAVATLADAPSAPAPLDPDQRLAAFSSAFGLTERETEVLAALTTSDSSMQDLARQLFMSRTALYRHISSMCGRVGVDNRQALLLCYFSWRPEDLG